MNFETFKQEVISAARALGITDYELYYQASEGTDVSVFQHEVSEFSASTDGGVCFRCIVGGKMGYASTERLDAEQAKDLVRRASENAATLESEEQVFLGEGGQSYRQLELKHCAFPGTEELIRTALDGQEKLYAADPSTVDGCSTECLAESVKIAICNSKGLDLSYENSLSGLVMAGVVSDGTEMADNYEIKLGQLDQLDLEALAKKTAKGAVEKLGGDVAPTGVYPVVFSPDAMASLLATFCGIFSAEVAQKGLSRLADQEGKTIASSVVTLVDDPFHPESPMPISFDAEGSPTDKKNVIENGVLSTLLYNLKTAAVAGKKTTGNASKGGYNAPVTVRPFTMYLAPGELSEEQLLQEAGNGVFINSLGGLHAGANPISGDFSLQSAGFMIEGGKKTTHVKSFTVAGNFYDLLQNITALSDKVELPSATGMTAFGAPCVLVKNLSVAGK